MAQPYQQSAYYGHTQSYPRQPDRPQGQITPAQTSGAVVSRNVPTEQQRSPQRESNTDAGQARQTSNAVQPSQTPIPVQVENVKRSASNKQWAKNVGQVVPAPWKPNVHFAYADGNTFYQSEMIVVKRSNGSYCFGQIEKINVKAGTYEISVDSGDSKNPASSMKSGVPARQLGKIAENAGRIVAVQGMEHSQSFTEKAAEIMNRSHSIACRAGNREILPTHVALSLFDKNRTVSAMCQNVKIDFPQLISLLNSQIAQASGTPAPSMEQVCASTQLNRVISLAKENSTGFIDIPQLLIAVCSDPEITKLLSVLSVSARDIKDAVDGFDSMLVKDAPIMAPEQDDDSALAQFSTDIVQQARDGKLDPVVGREEEISRVVRVLARRTKNNPCLIGEPGVGKTSITEGLAQRIVAGDIPEVLKDCRIMSLDMGALIAGAKLQGEFEDRLKQVLKEVQDASGKIILFIDEIHLVLGAGRSSGDSGMDAANLLKPMLARGVLRCIGATTLNEYRKYIEKDSAFERRFQQVYVAEPTVIDTISILRGIKNRYESHHRVTISDQAIVAAATLSKRYITQRFLPDKAIDLMDEACANVRVQLDSKPEALDQLDRKILRFGIEEVMLKTEREGASTEKLRAVQEGLSVAQDERRVLIASYEAQKERNTKVHEISRDIEQEQRRKKEFENQGNVDEVTKSISLIKEMEWRVEKLKAQTVGDLMVTETVGAEQIAEVVSRWTGIPVTKLNQTEKEKTLLLKERLMTGVVGQDQPVTAIANAIIRSRAGLGNDNKPVGSFLFLGPSGVGKTETAKVLAMELFNDEKTMVRLDMSEYVEAHTVYRLIGAPPGYAGYDQGGQLTEAVRRRPYCVVLCDELEKAHPQVWNILLQVMDEGRLTDGQGRLVDFKNAVVILTSNVGAMTLLEGIELENCISRATRQKVMQQVKARFPPELLNRFDEVAIYNPLAKDHVASILKIQMKKYSAALMESKKIAIDIDDTAASILVAKAYNPRMGARPLKRMVERVVMTSLSKLVLRGVLDQGAKVLVTSSGANIVYQVTDKYSRITLYPEEYNMSNWGEGEDDMD